MIGQQLVSQDPAGVTLQPFGEDPLEGIEVLRLVENICPGVAPVQGVINSTRFVCSSWSTRRGMLSAPNSPEKES
jgi:hypothetical protein